MRIEIILASSSPRRVQLLREAGLRPRVVPPRVSEALRPGEKPRALVARLCREKAREVHARLGGARGGRVIVAADTIVVSPRGGRILGKPRNRAEAVRMLSALSGRSHVVLTGYCLLGSREIVRVIRSRVRMRKLTPAQIRRYVRTGEPSDKAGAYAAQGKGMALIESITGSYTNVVGLPLSHVIADLESSFGVELFPKHGPKHGPKRGPSGLPGGLGR